MQQQLFQLYRGVFLFNSVFLAILGIWVMAIPQQLTASIEAYSGFNWAEFAFNEPMVGAYIIGLFQLLGGFYTCLGIAGFLLIFFGLQIDNKGYRSWLWWGILPTHILPFALILTFDFYIASLGAIEIVKIVVAMLTVMAWWRLRK